MDNVCPVYVETISADTDTAIVNYFKEKWYIPRPTPEERAARKAERKARQTPQERTALRAETRRLLVETSRLAQTQERLTKMQ